MKGKLNIFLLIFSAIGGMLAWFVGEAILSELTLPAPLIIGFYFGIASFFICTMCLFAETIFPIINGYSWKNKYAKTSWKYVAPISFVPIFVIAMLFQLIYGSDFNNIKKANDILLVIDQSESMKVNDPHSDSVKAAKELISSMSEENRVQVVAFNDKASVVQELTVLDSSATRQSIYNRLDEIKYDGTTDISAALKTTYDSYMNKGGAAANAIVIFLSDGENEFDINAAVKPFIESKISISTVGVLQQNQLGKDILKKISSDTMGSYYEITDVNNIKRAFDEIYRNNEQRLLADSRYGNSENSFMYALLRVVFIALIGMAIAFTVVIIFDNRELSFVLALGGLLGGVGAGVLLEFFINTNVLTSIYRLAALLILSCFFTLFTIFAEQNNNRPMGSTGFRK